MLGTPKKFQSNAPASCPHSGELLTKYFKEKRTHKSALARHINRLPKTVYAYQKNASIQTTILWEISLVLKHNFFADMAAQLPDTFSTYAPVKTEQSDQIAALELQVKILTAERDILAKTFGKG